MADHDHTLVQEALAGDEESFAVLMHFHYEPVFRRVVAIVHNPEDARDLCQEIWVKIWQHLPNFAGDSKFTTWVHPIATRHAIDFLRKKRRWYDRFLPFSQEVGDGGVAEPSTQENAADLAERSEARQRYADVIASLPIKLRTALALRELEGLSYQEIATTLNVKPGTVMSRLHHARRLLAQKLKD